MSLRTHSPMIVRSVRSNDVFRSNTSFEELVGFGADALAADELVSWIHPHDRWQFEKLVAIGEGCLEARHRANGGAWVDISWEVRTVEGGTVVLGVRPGEATHDGRRVGVVNTAGSPTLGETLNGMARIVEAKNPGTRCSILLVTPCGEHVSVGAGPSLPQSYNDAVEGLRIGPTVGSCGTAAFWNVPVIVEDITSDTLWADLRELAAMAGVKACWSYPIRATGGEVLGAMAIYTDEPRSPTGAQMDGLEIASRMVGLAVERDLLEHQLREDEKMKAIGRLAGGVAHNFNNLLTVILGHVDLIREEPNQPPDMRTLDTIVHAVKEASEITGQLLAFGQHPPTKAVGADLNEALHDLTRVLDQIIGDLVTVSIETDPSLRWVAADRGHLGQIMLNLMLNARDAMPGGGHILIRTRNATARDVAAVNAALPASRYIAVSVTDNGHGMNDTVREKAFEPFFTTREGTGTGLGLATVYALTDQHGGYVTLESEPGMGTTVTLLFPQGDPQAVAPGEAKEAEGRGVVATALVAEDNDEIRGLVVAVLSKAGFAVTEARNGAEAWALFESGHQADLLVTDVMMARMGGGELAQRVRAKLPDTRVLYISGHPLDRLRLGEPDPTREMYLAKPFSPAQLRDCAYRALALPGDRLPESERYGQMH